MKIDSVNPLDLIYSLPHVLGITFQDSITDFGKLYKIIRFEANKLGNNLKETLESFNLNDSVKRAEIFNTMTEREKSLFFDLYTNIINEWSDNK